MVLYDFAGTLPIEELWAWTITYRAIAVVLSSTVLALALWRTWRFTVSPILYPTDPKELPYWIPVIGHAVSFFNNSNGLLTRAREHFGDTREPFTLTVAGGQLHVLTNPKDVENAYKNTSTLTFDGFVQAIMRTFGSSEYCINAMYSYIPHSPHEKDFPNPLKKPVAKLSKDLHVKQLFPGDHLDDLGNKFANFFDESLVLKDISKKDYATQKTPESIVVPLLLWSSEVFVMGGQRAYFGRLLEDIDPSMARRFIEFDELDWQVLFQYPRFASRRMHALADSLIKNLETYHGTPTEKRMGDAWFTKAFEHEARQAGIGTHEIATMMLTVYWGINTNTRNACFWMLAYLVSHPDLMDAVRSEMASAFDSPGCVNFHYLNDSCPQLGAIWNETLRMTASSTSVRYLIADTVIGGKTLRKNNRVMIPSRQLHFNEEVFGRDAHQFDPDRFIRNKALLKGSSWRPFGGGTTICPGRFVAKQAVLTMIAILLHRFDVDLAESGPFPRLEEGKPVLGIMCNKKGDNPLIRLRERSTPV